LFHYVKVLLVMALSALPCIAARSDAPVVTILSTDLSVDLDVDDWFDTFLFVQLPALHPQGIILEHYATDEVEAKTREFTQLLGHGDLPVVRGIQEKLTGTTDAPVHSGYGDGADFILDTMRTHPGKVRLIAVGSLRNEAIAYHRDPTLFLRKIERLYWAGGRLDGKGEANLSRDLLAVDIIVNAPMPLVWVPCTAAHKQKLSGALEQRIAAASNPASEFITNMITPWRAKRGEVFLKNTGQTFGQGKNLWSLPALLHAAGEGAEWMTFVPGEVGFDQERLTSFKRRNDGPDLMLDQRDPDAICAWATELIVTFHPGQP
jgi:hypothetical protein